MDFFGVPSVDKVGRCTASYLLAGPVHLRCLVLSRDYVHKEKEDEEICIMRNQERAIQKLENLNIMLWIGTTSTHNRQLIAHTKFLKLKHK
jgi:hypothetical protein